jgi:hypothetical protein
MMDAIVRQDAISVEVFANLFKAIVDEMAWIVLRSSHTTFVKETQDFAVSLVTHEGEIFAYPYGSGATPIMGVPMHAGTMAFDDWQPGDVMMTNDPYSTGGMVMHLNDIYLFRPIFVEDRLLCFAWTFIHCTDVGGYAPGSIDMRNNEIFQEGLRLRPIKLMRQGVLNQELWNIFSDNCRIPALNWGDITACLAALDKAERRIVRLVERYGYSAVHQAIYATLDRTEQLARQVLAHIPQGEFRFDEYFEDDYVSDLPVRITATLTSRETGRNFRFGAVSGVPAQRACRGTGIRSAGVGEALRAATGHGGRRPISWRLRRGIRSSDPAPERCRGDARQRPAPLLRLGSGGRPRRDDQRQSMRAAGTAAPRSRQADRLPCRNGRSHPNLERRWWRVG